MNKIYERLSGIGFLSKSYTFKFLFIAFLGIHIPLIGLVIFVLLRPAELTTSVVLILTLLLTLGATAITLLVMNGLLAPLRKSREALDQFLLNKELPQLPVRFRDEAGILMSNIQFTLTELNDLLNEKQDLASLLSHDLRIPAHNVKTLAEFLLQEDLSPGIRETIGMIIDSSTQQITFLDDVLAMLRQDHILGAGTGYQSVNTSTLVNEAISSFAGQAKQKNIRLAKELAFDGSVDVQPELFRQVLKNLVSNAIKFSNEGSEVKVAVKKQSDKTVFEVKDAGIGFEPNVGEKLFERFTKHGRSGTAGESSTGIGLHLSRKIIKHHKGNLAAISHGPGTGSTFVISL